MRNRLLYTSTLPTNKDFYTLNLSLLIAEKYHSSAQTLLSDSFATVNQTIRSQIPEGISKLVLTNFGILVEPDLNLNPSRLLLDLALDYEVILHWEGSIASGKRLAWDMNKPSISIDFPENTLQKLEPST